MEQAAEQMRCADEAGPAGQSGRRSADPSSQGTRLSAESTAATQRDLAQALGCSLAADGSAAPWFARRLDELTASSSGPAVDRRPHLAITAGQRNQQPDQEAQSGGSETRSSACVRIAASFRTRELLDRCGARKYLHQGGPGLPEDRADAVRAGTERSSRTSRSGMRCTSRRPGAQRAVTRPAPGQSVRDPVAPGRRQTAFGIQQQVDSYFKSLATETPERITVDGRVSRRVNCR
jgi:hypothetical protein